MEQICNQILLRGELEALPVFSHESHGRRFSRFSLAVERLSGAVDVLGQARESTPAAEEQGDLLPKDEQDALTKQRKRNALQTQLNLAVEEERFEEAAKLRDELKALEQ